LFEQRIVQPLMDEELLVGTEISPIRMEGFAMVLHHRTAPFFVPYFAWGRLQLRDTAKLFLELNLRLLQNNLALRDAHGGNVAQFDCCHPVWIDFGSIGRVGDGSNDTLAPDVGLGEYRLRYANPLKLMSSNARLARSARGIMHGGGLDDEELEALIALGAPPKKPDPAPVVKAQETWFQRKLRRLRKRIRRRFGRTQPATAVNPNREALLKSALESLPSSFPMKDTTWSNYQNRELLPDSYDGAEARARMVRSLLEKIRPTKVVDLAANAGYFSFMAARGGAHVLALDCDEQAIDRLYTAAVDCEEKTSVTAGCFDILQPPEARHPTLVPNYCGDLTLALALTHHLSLGQQFPFSHITKTFARYTTNALISEFMPNGLGVNQPSPVPLPAWYRLDALVEELSRNFKSVETIKYEMEPGRSPRTMLLCREVVR
jgi:hypothetical protein